MCGVQSSELLLSPRVYDNETVMKILSLSKILLNVQSLTCKVFIW